MLKPKDTNDREGRRYEQEARPAEQSVQELLEREFLAEEQLEEVMREVHNETVRLAEREGRTPPHGVGLLPTLTEVCPDYYDLPMEERQLRLRVYRRIIRDKTAPMMQHHIEREWRKRIAAKDAAEAERRAEGDPPAGSPDSPPADDS